MQQPELVSVAQVLVQGRRIKFANVPERQLLIKELLAFKVKVSALGNETFESWRERDHDDLVLAVLFAAWLGEREGFAWSAPEFVTQDPPDLREETRRRVEFWEKWFGRRGLG